MMLALVWWLGGYLQQRHVQFHNKWLMSFIGKLKANNGKQWVVPSSVNGA